MGVPGFFAWILKKFKTKILISKLQTSPDYLFIDANCLFHPECFKILEHYIDETNLSKLEKYMFKRIVNYLDYIENFVKPNKMMYISVDGTAPLAKINQQRKRRYKSVVEHEQKNAIRTKYHVKCNSSWSNTCITPGTRFMEDLHQYLLKHYSKKSKIQYIYSSYHTAGEGEHKILQYIKANNTNNCVIYGLDADLIFLSLASRKNNIYLLREESHFGCFRGKASKTSVEITSPKAKLSFNNKKVEKELFDPVLDVAQNLIYVSMDEAKKAYNTIIHEMLDSDEHYETLHHDLIFICFLLGNDFLPHFPSIDIHSEGLDEIINSYVECLFAYKQTLITINENKIKINNDMFIDLLEKLGNKEDHYFKNIMPMYFENFRKRRFLGSSDCDRELWEFENLKKIKIHDPIKLGYDDIDDYKFRYYEQHFHTCEHQQEFVEQLSYMYIEGIKWVSEYYFSKCTDWEWTLPYNHAPFISDIARTMRKLKININDIKFHDIKPIPIFCQLISVLHPDSKYLLPTSYQKIMNDSDIKDLFPKKFKIDTLYKTQYWQCDPILPYLDIDRIKKETKKAKLSLEESQRSESFKDFKFK